MKRLLFLSFTTLLASVSCCHAPQKPVNTTPDGRLVRAETPAADFDPAGLDAFEAAFTAAGFDIHSVMVLHHGRVVAEKWWGDGAPDSLHIMNSVSKSFTATAFLSNLCTFSA